MPTPQSEAFFQKINDGRPVNRRRQSSKKGTIKMIRRFLLLAAVSAAGITAPAWAKSNDKDKDAGWSLQEALGKPEGLTISGSFRVRYEALHNQFRPGLDRKRSEEHTSELQSLMSISYAVFCLQKKHNI